MVLSWIWFLQFHAGHDGIHFFLAHAHDRGGRIGGIGCGGFLRCSSSFFLGGRLGSVSSISRCCGCDCRRVVVVVVAGIRLDGKGHSRQGTAGRGQDQPRLQNVRTPNQPNKQPRVRNRIHPLGRYGDAHIRPVSQFFLDTHTRTLLVAGPLPPVVPPCAVAAAFSCSLTCRRAAARSRRFLFLLSNSVWDKR